jgi:hypothetical protein
MQLTVLIQFPLMVWEIRNTTAEVYQRWRSNLFSLIFPTGAILGIHFWTVSMCVAQTSLTHAILLVNAPPLFLVSWSTLMWLASWALFARASTSHTELKEGGAQAALQNTDTTVLPEKPSLLRRFFDPVTCLPPTTIEAVGAVIAFCGVAGLVASTSAPAATATGGSPAIGLTESKATLQGDLIGLIASATLGFYFAVGGRVRKWCPLFAWLYPYTPAPASPQPS